MPETLTDTLRVLSETIRSIDVGVYTSTIVVQRSWLIDLVGLALLVALFVAVVVGGHK